MPKNEQARTAGTRSSTTPEALETRVGDITRAVGHTPVVALRTLKPRPNCAMLLKLESTNPGGSVKDRPALHIVNEAERTGALVPGGTIIESSSGNFGISLAMIGAARGYRVIILVDPKTTRTNLNLLKTLDAEVVVVADKDETGSYHKSRIRRAIALAAEIENSFRPDQCSNPENAVAHYMSTGREILEQVGGEIDAIVIPTSTGGQLAGVARAVKQQAPEIRVIAADVRGSGIFTSKTRTYYTPGMGMAWTPISLDFDLIDAVHVVPDEDAATGARLLARREGILSGASTGSVFQVMAHVAQRIPGARVLGIQSDRGDRYLDTIYSDAWLEEHGFRIDIDTNEFFQRARRNAPLPNDEVEYVKADPTLVPADWLATAEAARLKSR
jgi:cystathionine beta-synthase/cysteine synthase A